MAEKESAAEKAARESIKQESEARKKAMEEREKNALPPTPTQEENDMAAHGCHVMAKGDDAKGNNKSMQAEKPSGGYQKLYVETVTQADKGADLDFLLGCRGHAVPRESH